MWSKLRSAHDAPGLKTFIQADQAFKRFNVQGASGHILTVQPLSVMIHDVIARGWMLTHNAHLHPSVQGESRFIDQSELSQLQELIGRPVDGSVGHEYASFDHVRFKCLPSNQRLSFFAHTSFGDEDFLSRIVTFMGESAAVWKA
jgi:hypothetical protein